MARLRSAWLLLSIALCAGFTLLLNLALAPTHEHVQQHGLLSLRSKIHARLPSMAHLSSSLDHTGEAIKRFDDSLWRSVSNMNVTQLPKMFPESVPHLNYSATSLYLSEHLHDFQNSTNSLLESTENKLSQFLFNTQSINYSATFFTDPLHYDYDHMSTVTQMELFLNSTRNYFDQTRKKLNQIVTAISSSSNDALMTTDENRTVARPGIDASLISENTEDKKAVDTTTTSAVGSGLSMLQALFSSLRQGSVAASASADPPAVTGGQGDPPSLTITGGCLASFPPKCDMNNYVRFWKKQFNEQDCLRSPLLRLRSPASVHDEVGGNLDNRISSSFSSLLLQRYVVFQPDQGGWNNIRMAAETAIVFALATGRTLVLPPNMTFYLLNKNGDAKRDTSSLDTYFDLRKISELVTIITMPEFLTVFEKLGKNNTLPARETPQSLGGKNRGKLWKYLENTCYTRDYHPGRMFFGFNISSSPDHDGVHFGPIARDARRKRMAAHDREVVPYDSHLDSVPCVYFPGDYREKYRILTHFYSYLYWAKPAEERRYKRLVRDRLHYRDDIFCAAGKVVHLILAESYFLGSTSRPSPTTSPHADVKSSYSSSSTFPCRGLRVVNYIAQSTVTSANDQSSRSRSSHSFETCHNRVTLGGDTGWRGGPTFFAMHIRRGDFQYGHTRRSATDIWNNVKHLLDANVTRLLYISTDEKNASFFDPFREVYTVKFLRDFEAPAGLLPQGDGKGFNQNWLGMVEQIVCSSAHTFIGTPLSTFTGYITRMRGYHRDGRYANTFYFLPSPMYQLHTQPELQGPFWAREFAVAHKDVDDDRQEMDALERQ